MGAEAQKKDPVAMYGVIDTVQVVSQRVRHANEANAGAKVSRIDPEIMRANKTRSLAELLTDYTAIYIKSLGMGALSTASFRGASPSQTRVNWNGINITPPMSGTFDFSQIPVFFTDNVSLYYGSSHVKNGTGSIGGSVNLFTDPDWNTGVSGKVLGEYGSYGTYTTGAQVNTGGQKSSFKTRLYYQHSDNNYTYLNKILTNEPFREKRQDADYTQWAADRGVHIRLLVDGMESWIDMEGNPYFYGLSSHENVEIKLYNKANPLKPWKMMGRMHDKYLIADGKRYILGGRNTHNYFLGDFPGHKNYDRDVLVVCDEPEKENSVNQLLEYFETIWEQEDSGYFHDNKKLANRKSVKNAVLELQNGYQKYFEENKERICDTDYTDETFETEKIALVSNPIHTGSKEPVVWYQLGELMKNAKNRVKIHTPYIICNDMMYNTWEEIAENVSDFSIMTNSVANNGNPFGAADYAKNRNRILSTGINIWEYEGGYSYHGKSILIDDDLSVIGSFNMDMRSAYLDTELMLVIRSKDINKQLEEGMMEYERVSRQVLEDGTYRDPYHVEPIELTKKRQRKIFLVQHLLGWARYLF